MAAKLHADDSTSPQPEHTNFVTFTVLITNTAIREPRDGCKTGL